MQAACARNTMPTPPVHNNCSTCLPPHPTQIQLDAQRKALDQLTANVRVLESKLSEARNKRETLKARAASAKSSKQITEVSE
jgi:hypothetical protein